MNQKLALQLALMLGVACSAQRRPTSTRVADSPLKGTPPHHECRIRVSPPKMVAGEAIQEVLEEGLQEGGWTLPGQSADSYRMEVSVGQVGVKSTLRLSLHDGSALETLASASAGASPHVFPNVAPRLLANLLEQYRRSLLSRDWHPQKGASPRVVERWRYDACVGAGKCAARQQKQPGTCPDAPAIGMRRADASSFCAAFELDAGSAGPALVTEGFSCGPRNNGPSPN